ncbi:Stf0 family sulfotransferase [Thalassorhabdomicrobium marinisediminis]|uniref:Stf0 family sulfotransferase n=1 Tax=Thalassorhabdomicrobium marinisediminis TaxID=2170577 RepID=UPI0024924715|nr:Stf0 family sulfotransferase [Thalassorhabdomicrobium marinisediminis]
MTMSSGEDASGKSTARQRERQARRNLERRERDRIYQPTRSAEFDFPKPAPEVKSKLIFATTPRCGSHFICSTLFQTYRVGLPLEYFNPAHFESWGERAGASSQWEALSHLVARRTGGNGVFSAKVHWTHFEALPSDRMRNWFRHALWVRIERADLVAQAVSWEIAAQTGSFIYTQPSWKTPQYDFDRIYDRLVQILTQRAAWSRYFEERKIKPKVLVLEQFLQDPDAQSAALIKALGLPRAKGPRAPSIPVVKSQQREINSGWRSRFVDQLAKRAVL